MKKFLSTFMAMVISLSVMVMPVMAEDVITVTLDGEKIEFDVQPQIINERTMVPVRAIFESIGATVDWDQETQTVISEMGDTRITLTIDEPVMYVNGIAKELDTPAMIIDERTLVPARAISEAYGLNVDWIQETQTVVITTVPAIDTPVEGNSVAEAPAETIKQSAMYKLSTGIREKGTYSAMYGTYSYLRQESGVDIFMSYEPAIGDINMMVSAYQDDVEVGTYVFLFANEDAGLNFEISGYGTQFELYGTFVSPDYKLSVISSDVPDDMAEETVDFIWSCLELMDAVLAEDFGVSIYDLGINY